MSGAFLVVNLLIAIIIMIALILVPRLNPALSLVIASIYMGCNMWTGFRKFYRDDRYRIRQYDGGNWSSDRLWCNFGTAHE